MPLLVCNPFAPYFGEFTLMAVAQVRRYAGYPMSFTFANMAINFLK
jgi:hypothetical protein